MRDTSLPPRPKVILYGAALLGVCSIILVFAWIAAPDSVLSNGGQVFFIVLWAWLAYSAYFGAGFVRAAIALIIIGSVWSIINSDTGLTSLSIGSSAGDLLSKIIGIIALAVFTTKPARTWFQTIHTMQKNEKK